MTAGDWGVLIVTGLVLVVSIAIPALIVDLLHELMDRRKR